ncbi:anti-repressor SinI family protein [Peribacillus loiseleuriae]|uniref:anti-repressor SinI family protein n=1 Tax=Peribacillus loiseleuriae TaxID=1679170 RepID=UPI0012E2E1CA|nr:anti-repressor SinI family protein [Peribacillus loiseleuriae]
MNKYGKDVENIPMTEDVDEWVNLLKEAKKIGLTLEEVHNFFRNFKNSIEH